MTEYPSSHIFWINVHEGLPKENIPVLAWEKQGFIYVDRIIDGKWEIASNNGGEVTFWMPLPEPPKEERKMVEKYYNENKTAIAVLISNGYGAGWSTWNNEYEEPFQIAYDKRVVEFWMTHHDEEFIEKISWRTFDYDEDGCSNELEEFLNSIGYGGIFTGGYVGLGILWVPVGSRFKITEYDGSEGLYILDINDFALA